MNCDIMIHEQSHCSPLFEYSSSPRAHRAVLESRQSTFEFYTEFLKISSDVRIYRKLRKLCTCTSRCIGIQSFDVKEKENARMCVIDTEAKGNFVGAARR